MIAVFGLTILYAPHAGRHYLVVAVLMAGAQFMTRPVFPLVR